VLSVERISVEGMNDFKRIPELAGCINSADLVSFVEFITYPRYEIRPQLCVRTGARLLYLLH
jgi:hypothetical protein